MKIILYLLMLFGASMAMAGHTSPPMQVSGAKTVKADEAKQLFDEGALFIDVREKKDWNAGRIPGAIHLSYRGEFTHKALKKLANVNEAIVIYCNGEKCFHSSEMVKQAVDWGYNAVFYFRDGYPVWRLKGFPVE